MEISLGLIGMKLNTGDGEEKVISQGKCISYLVVPHVSEEGPVQVPPGPSFFIHEPPPNDSGHPSSIDRESTDFEDNLETAIGLDFKAELDLKDPDSEKTEMKYAG
ncbi:hypothetical protein EMCRGX_G022809 [Ephydatia muelleri]